MIIVFLFTACNKPISESNEIEPTAAGQPTIIHPTETETPTEVPPTEAPNILKVEPVDQGSLVYDFTADICSARWSTNASHLPCPINLDEIDGVYIESTDHTVIEGMVSVEAPLLIGLPGNDYPVGYALFGRYPPITIHKGDTFHAIIACHGDADCNLEFALEMIDQYGNRPKGWRWIHAAGDGPQEISADLSSFAGRIIEFYLVLRQEGEMENQWGVWIQPHISRDPYGNPQPTVEILPTSTTDPGDQTPGVISGMVDMGSAPPYLKDSMNGGSSPVAVVFFNLSDGTYWWIHTSLTGHPNYQMTVPPGNYQVVAYAPGVDIVPYVTGGYTGSNPSCGKNLKTVVVPPNGHVENIVIADWNWTCGGTASRPSKPGGVPLP